MTDNSYPNDVGSVELESVKIYDFTRNASSSKEIVHLITRIDVYESLKNYTLSADIHIAEGIELMNYFPIRGEEYIQFTIQTPDRKRIKYDFFVESVSNVTPNETGMMKRYVFRCVTRDFLTNSYTIFSKRYRDLQYDQAIKQVISSDLGSSKSVKVEKTSGFFDYVVNNVRPFQVIDLLKERAVSGEDNISSTFFFYEDNERYNFTTLEKLIVDRKDRAQNFPFYYDVANLAGDMEKVINARNILSYQVTKQGSSISKIRSGRMSNVIKEFDIFHGTYFKKYQYNNKNDHKRFKETDQKVDFNSDEFNGLVSSKPGRISMLLKDGTRPEMKHNESVPFKGPYEEKISQYGLNIRVYGDTNLMVGDVIDINMPDISGVTNSPQEQKVYSGNYVVFTLNHSIIRQGNDGRFKHYMNLDLRKPNLKKGAN